MNNGLVFIIGLILGTVKGVILCLVMVQATETIDDNKLYCAYLHGKMDSIITLDEKGANWSEDAPSIKEVKNELYDLCGKDWKK